MTNNISTFFSETETEAVIDEAMNNNSQKSQDS